MTSTRYKQAFALLLCVALAPESPGAQTPPQTPPRASGTVQATATAVLVDVVVRDRRGQPITDLAAADFEVFEDGVLQDIGALTLYTPESVRRSPASNAPAATPTTVPDTAKPASEPPPEPIIALVFDRLTPEARAIAHKAALGYIGQAGESKSLVGVFGIDLSLITYQTYTRDSARLRKAVEDVGVRSTAQFESQAGKARDLAKQAAGAAGNLDVLAGGGQAAAQAAQGGAGAGAADAIAADMQRRTLETFEMLERDQQGVTTSNALLAVVNGMRALRGRKSVIFFSEGVAIPANVAARFRSVIDTANRANVSIYAMDAAGLRTESTSQETRDNINAAAQRTLQRNPTTDVVGAPMTEALERNEDNLRRDPHSGLGQLADETGGILIRNTNDLTGGFRRIDQDMRNYYMLSYVPKNDRLDGKFRTIAVKVKRGGAEVAARKGYYAVPSTGAMPVMSFEAPALVLLETTPVPNAFPVRVAALKFPEPGRPGLTPVLVSVPAGSLTFRQTEDQSSYRAEFTIVVRFKNAAKEVVDKLSQNYVLTGPMEKLESVKQGNVLFYREPELQPGIYSMEAIVHDALSERASVRFATVEQSKVEDNTLRASNLVLVGSAERVAETNRPVDNPFLVGDRLLYPNMGEPVRKSTTPELGFFFTVYPAKGAKPQAMLEVLQNGTALAKLPLPLGDADSAGRIQQVSRLPTAALAAGTYDLHLVITQAQQQISRSTIVRIVE
ncbi:MAG: VWA domain-containing protein [Vicinamibacterales bacterium]